MTHIIKEVTVKFLKSGIVICYNINKLTYVLLVKPSQYWDRWLFADIPSW